MDSLIVLAVPWSSLPIIWKLSCEVVWPEVELWLCMGGSFRCSLNLSPKVPEVSYQFLITCKVLTLEPEDGPTFVFHGVFILVGIQEIFNGTVALEVGLNAILTADLSDAFT